MWRKKWNRQETETWLPSDNGRFVRQGITEHALGCPNYWNLPEANHLMLLLSTNFTRFTYDTTSAFTTLYAPNSQNILFKAISTFPKLLAICPRPEKPSTRGRP